MRRKRRGHAGTCDAGQLPACEQSMGGMEASPACAQLPQGARLSVIACIDPAGISSACKQCLAEPPPALDAEWNTSNLAQTDNTPDCELNAVTAPGQFMGFPFCHTVPVNGNPYTQPYLRRPGASAAADPDLNAGDSVMKCTGEQTSGMMECSESFMCSCFAALHAWRQTFRCAKCIDVLPST